MELKKLYILGFSNFPILKTGKSQFYLLFLEAFERKILLEKKLQKEIPKIECLENRYFRAKKKGVLAPSSNFESDASAIPPHPQLIQRDLLYHRFLGFARPKTRNFFRNFRVVLGIIGIYEDLTSILTSIPGF